MEENAGLAPMCWTMRNALAGFLPAASQHPIEIDKGGQFLQFQITLAQGEVVAGDVADERYHHAAPGFFRRQVFGARGFFPADAVPRVDFPGERGAGLRVGEVLRRNGPVLFIGADGGIPYRSRLRVGFDEWRLRGARDS